MQGAGARAQPPMLHRAQLQSGDQRGVAGVATPMPLPSISTAATRAAAPLPTPARTGWRRLTQPSRINAGQLAGAGAIGRARNALGRNTKGQFVKSAFNKNTKLQNQAAEAGGGQVGSSAANVICGG